MPRLYLGNLPRKVEERDIKKFFNEYGRIRGIDLKNGYGFVEFDDKRDAEDAVHDLDGAKMLGERVTVEMARSSARFGNNNGGDRYGRSGGHDSRDNFANSRRPIRSEHRVIVEELSTRVSWQDLKDLMRKVGEVTFADAHKLRKNEGVVEFSNHSDMKAAISKFNGYELHGYKLRVFEDKKNGSKKRSKSRSRRRSTSKSQSRSRGKRSSSRRRSRSIKRSTSRKRSLSKSRSSSGRGFLKSKSPSSKKSESIKKSKSNSTKHKEASSSRSRSKSADKTKKEARDSKSPVKENSQSKSRSASKSRSVSKSRSKSRSISKSRSRTRSASKSRSKSPQENASPKSDGSEAERSNTAMETQDNNETMDSN